MKPNIHYYSGKAIAITITTIITLKAIIITATKSIITTITTVPNYSNPTTFTTITTITKNSNYSITNSTILDPINHYHNAFHYTLHHHSPLHLIFYSLIFKA